LEVLVENFMGSYHHIGADHATFQPILPRQHYWTEAEADYYCVCHLPLGKLQKNVKQGESQLINFAPIEGLHLDDFLEWSVHLAAPSGLFFVAADRVYWYRLQPLSAGKMTLRTTLLINPDSKNSPDYQKILKAQIQMIRKFHLEDVEMCTAVQNGLRSCAYTPGPLNKLEEPIWQFQRYMARQIKAAELMA
jgi:phenylpropionate dioxygenase-like ring-hydroxylating dioxygenase large terminal subunit